MRVFEQRQVYVRVLGPQKGNEGLRALGERWLPLGASDPVAASREGRLSSAAACRPHPQGGRAREMPSRSVTRRSQLCGESRARAELKHRGAG